MAEYIHQRARIHRREWASAEHAVVRDRGDDEYAALSSPEHPLVMAGGPAGGFGAVIPPWLGPKSRAADGSRWRMHRLRTPVLKRHPMSIDILDPTHESQAASFALARRPDSLVGATVGFISNGKEGTKGFFAHLERLLRERFGVAHGSGATKSNFMAPPSLTLLRPRRLAAGGIGPGRLR